MTHAELMRRMSARELAEWRVYYRLEPFGAERDAAHAGVISATVANFSGFRRSGDVFKPSDFMVDYLDAPEPEPSEEQREKLQAQRELALYAGLVALSKRNG
jgi:hypothetical protein